MSVTVSVESDIKRATRFLTRAQRKQVPFAAALAIKDTAFRTREYIVRRVYPSSFKVRNKRFAGVAFRVKPKRVSKTKLEAFVYDKLGRDFLVKQTHGGNKAPHASRYMKVPRQGDESVYTSTGKGRRFRNTFVTEGKYGPIILQRQGGRRSRTVKFRYGLRTNVHVSKRFYFYEKGGQFAARVFPMAFAKSFARALKTAR